jgi:beta-lactamase superfamily II metal-dependent hydrolase
VTCEVAFLPVGNADSIVIRPNGGSAVVVDVPDLQTLSDWLQNKSEANISHLYITHAHRDHFTPLIDLVPFLEDWIKCGNVEAVCLPYLAYNKALREARSRKNEDPRYARLAHALVRLKELDKLKLISFIPITRHSNPYQHGNLNINALHPSQLFIEEHLERTSGRVNEISVVLRVTYGNFSALLLADIEGAGLRECIDSCQAEELNANLVKIPHHGAFPKNGEDLRELLEAIDAEIAVLSVGSTNRYGHVMPKLFDLLIRLKNDTSRRLDNFICTEVTRTCVYSASQRAEMNKDGLKSKQLCAGEITILAETSGEWERKTQTNHADVVSKFKYAACDGRADLG